MTLTGPVTALVMGAISADIEPGGPTVPGGVVHHAGIALARLGVQTRVVTSARPEDADELLGPLRAEGVEIRLQPSRFTTVYENDYSGSRDAHELRAISDPVRIEEIPEEWRSADLIHLGPLHRGDLPQGVACALEGLVGMDLQGLVRERTPAGTRLSAFNRLAEFLEGVPIAKVSEEELPFVLDGEPVDAFLKRYDISELLVTRGARGASVITPQKNIAVPAVRAEQRHPVGAGDVFLSAYLCARIRGLAPVLAARLASHVSAKKVEAGEVPKGLEISFDPGDYS